LIRAVVDAAALRLAFAGPAHAPDSRVMDDQGQRVCRGLLPTYALRKLMVRGRTFR
jgi:hypothetical protein